MATVMKGSKAAKRRKSGISVSAVCRVPAADDEEHTYFSVTPGSGSASLCI